MDDSDSETGKNLPLIIRWCKHAGVAGTTDLHIQKTTEGYEARIGIAIMGCTNMSLEELEKANPFDADFRDNYASGIGTTEQEAIKAMQDDMQQMADTLWI